MRVPTAAELLDVWEDGLPQPPPLRIARLLASADAEPSGGDVLAWSIGRRDARVLELRERLFGASMTVVTACPACAETVESTFLARDLRLADDPVADEERTIEDGGHRVRYRLPNSGDLVAAARAPDADAARRAIFERCVLGAHDVDGDPVDAGALPDTVRAAVARDMATADPQADVWLALTCPACAHTWQAAFDVAGFVWREIHAWALRTLRDVHTLARAYGWREADVLALGPTRRHVYLTLSRQ